ncbi:hypothetical protein WTH01_17960 [Weissella thailandensis]|nr:hypothetical protein WTH01_17960 [Weissella thailandensis]
MVNPFAMLLFDRAELRTASTLGNNKGAASKLAIKPESNVLIRVRQSGQLCFLI